MTPDEFKSKYNLRFADNDTFNIAEQDLREFNADLVALLKRGSNEQPGGPFAVRWYFSRYKTDANDTSLEELPLALLHIGCTCRVELGRQAGEYVLVWDSSPTA
ncbi:hypothetical protein BXP70_29365, partial [Hymenobacter crusticola]